MYKHLDSITFQILNHMKTLSLFLLLASLCIPVFSQTLKGVNFAEGDSVEVKIFLDGNLRGIANGENNSDETTNASGMVGLEVASDKSVINLAVNIASSIDSIGTNFGSIVLNPYSGRSFQSGLLDVRLKQFPLHTYFSVSNLFFKTESNRETASILYYGASYYHSIFSGDVGNNKVEAFWETGLGFRHISGNAANNSDFYQEIFKTDRKFFPGLEGGIQIGFNDLTAGIQVYYLLDGDKDQNINDISGLQITGGVGFRGAFFKGKAKKKE